MSVHSSAGLAVVACLALTTVGACSTPSSPSAAPRPSPGIASATTLEARLPVGDQPVTLDPADFTADIDHPYWPMRPGSRYTYTYTETDDQGSRQTTVVVVTTRTKRIANGVTARVVRDTVTKGGAIIEDTFDWYAQDSRGNLWYLGEDTAEFEHGEITSRAGSFEAGVDGAQPGILLPADPQPGQRYRQEYYRGVAEDNGEVLSTSEMADAELGHYTDVLLTKDTIALQPKVMEYKLYAKGVGLVLTIGVSGGASREVLTKIDRAPATAGTGPLGRPNP